MSLPSLFSQLCSKRAPQLSVKESPIASRQHLNARKHRHAQPQDQTVTLNRRRVARYETFQSGHGTE